ncbi:MAG: LysR family transcriptional regulator [Proteobacteria bacterium]|nr:LysR family transcriptional regulator [Pseudomonadota bacterium]
MKPDQLRHFYEVAQRQHIGLAAKSLRASAAGVSYSIECLEEELGVELFLKQGKRIFLTEAGRRLLEKVPVLQKNIDEIKSYVSLKTAPLEGKLRIGATHLLANLFAAPLVSKVLSDHQKLSAELLSMRSSDVVSAVLLDEIDVGICFSPQQHPSLTVESCYKGRLNIYLKPSHPLFKNRSSVSELNRFDAVLPKAFGGVEICQTHPVFEAFGIVPNPRFLFDSYHVGIAMVENSHGWGFFPDCLEEVPKFPLKRLKMPPSFKADYSIALISRKDRYLGRSIQVFKEMFKGIDFGS